MCPSQGHDMPELQGFHILHCTALHGGTNSVLQCSAPVYCFVLSKIFAIKLHLLGGSPCPVPYWPSQGGWITLVTRRKPLQVPPEPHHGVQGAKPSEQPTPHQLQGSRVWCAIQHAYTNVPSPRTSLQARRSNIFTISPDTRLSRPLRHCVS